MRRRSWMSMSLARKITLLLGASVLLTISATLAFPWLQMSWLNAQAMLLQAKRVASAAHQAVDLRQPSWVELQRQLVKLWPALVEELDLPEQYPTLVPAQVAFARPQGFCREAARRLAQNPHQPYFWKMQDGDQRFRFAMAVRGAVTDPHPLALRGLIDVALPVPQAPFVWNATVTALAGASGAVLAILVFYVVSRRLVLQPVEMLRCVAEKVAGGDITVQSSIQSGDEFQELSNTFNDMLAHLRTAQEEQRTINRSLDIRLGELAETNVGLYESNRLKSEFLGNVSHELRTPLVSIIGFAELLLDCWENPEPDRDRMTRYADHILTSGRSLLEIINDLLDLAKIEAGKLELHISEFSMTQLGTDLVDFVRPLVDKRRQRIELHLADDLPLMHSDSGKIKQILYNLLSNAIKFTPEEGLVMLRLEKISGKGVRMIVSDTGPGIAADQHERVFEQFRQLDASNTREHEGTGLGLAITRELVTVLGGTIQLDSSDGNGAMFTVELPIEVPSFAQRTRQGAAADMPTGSDPGEA